MRWNAGLAALAAAWGLVAVLARRRRRGAGPLAFLRLPLAAVDPRRRSPSSRAGFTSSSRDRIFGARRARRRPGGALVALLRGREARLRRARRAHVLHGPALPRGSRAVVPAGAALQRRPRRARPRRDRHRARRARGRGRAHVRLGRPRLRARLGAHVRGAARALETAAPRGRRAAHGGVLGLPRGRRCDLAGAPARRHARPGRRGDWAAVLVLGIGLTGLSTLATPRSSGTRRPRRRASSRSSSPSRPCSSPGSSSASRSLRRRFWCRSRSRCRESQSSRWSRASRASEAVAGVGSPAEP